MNQKGNEPMRKRVLFAIDDDLHAWLQRYAKTLRRSVSDTIRVILEEKRADVGG